MKRFAALIAVLCLLSGCASAQPDSSYSESALSLPEPVAIESPPSVSVLSESKPDSKEPLSLETLREKYETTGGILTETRDGLSFSGPANVYNIYPLEGNAAVIRYEPQNYEAPGKHSFFDFVDLTTGNTVNISHYNDDAIRSCEVTGTANGYCLDILDSGINPAYPVRNFPARVTFSGKKGSEFIAEIHDELYFLPLGETATVGALRPETLTGISLTVSGPALSFGPQKGKELDFMAGSVTPPLMEVSFPDGIFTVVMKSTQISDAISSADIIRDDGLSPVSDVKLEQRGEDAILTFQIASDKVSGYNIRELPLTDVSDPETEYLSIGIFF